MAKYEVACSRCEKGFTVQLYGPNRDREWQLNNWTWTCDECKEVQKREAAEEAARLAEEAGLPELKGTEKQIHWAEVLRVAKLHEIDRAIEDGTFEDLNDRFWMRHGISPMDALTIQGVLTSIKGQIEASFWIDRRGILPLTLFCEFAKKWKRPEENALAKDAKCEATLRPEKVKSETVAEIRSLPDRVEIIFPERNEEFRLLVKGLRYGWDGQCWQRNMSIYSGSSEDRAAEAANKILAAGFPVRIFNESIRKAAIEGNYEPECDRWVSARTDGKFAIRWWQGDFYKAAKRLPAARYDKPVIIVPPEHFEEVLDFAQVHEFRLTPGAVKLAEDAKAERQKAVTVAVRPGRKVAPPKTKRPVLEKPQGQEIPDEYKD